MKSTDKIHLLRLFAFIGIIAVAVGSRLYSGGLCSVWRNGTYTVYGAHDEETVYDRIPILGVRSAYERIDTRGGEQTALDMLEKSRATVAGVETVGKTKIYYAYSPYCGKGEQTVYGTVNVMIAVRGDSVAAGSPLLKGSY